MAAHTGHPECHSTDASLPTNVTKTAADEALLSIDFIWALSEAVTALNLSRRATLDWLAETIFGWLEHGGTIIDANGRRIEVDDELIDRVHGDDPSCVWISELKQKAKRPPQRRSKATMLSRLQLYDAAFRIIGKPLS